MSPRGPAPSWTTRKSVHSSGVTTIALDDANCYLLAAHDGFALIDTG